MGAIGSGLARRTSLVAAVSIVAVGVVSFVIAVTTLPHSGPVCRVDCLGYPYVGGAELVPRGFVWMYPATVLVLRVVPLADVLEAAAVPPEAW